MSIASRMARLVGSRRVGANAAGPVDTDAPTVPANIAASSITATTLTLTWDASTDNVGVTEYEVQQRLASGVNGDYVTIGTVAAPTVTLAVTGLTGSTEYRFRVRARDAAGNVSAWGPDETGLLADTFVFVAPEFSVTSGAAAVYAIEPDGAGGFYFGGVFDQVTDDIGSHARAQICHVDAYGRVTPWNPGSNRAVYDIKVWNEDYVVVGKYRTTSGDTLGGVTCQGFGIVDRATGLGVVWNPAVITTVRALAIDPATNDLFVGLSGTSGIRKHNLIARTGAAFCTTNGAVNTLVWDAERDELLVAYAGFTLGGVSREEFGVLSSLGIVTSWNAACTASGFSGLEVDADGSVWLFAASLTSAGGSLARGIGRVDRDTALAVGWVQDASLASGTSVIGHWISATHVFGCTNASDAEARTWDAATGITTQIYTTTGTLAGTGGWTFRGLAPVSRAAIIIGAGTDIAPDKLSGTRAVFALAYP